MAEVKEYISNITIPDGTTKYVKDAELTNGVTELSTKVSTNETNISELSTKTDEADKKISELQNSLNVTNANVSNNSEQIKTNQSNILTNSTKIGENTADIKTNKSNIETNTSDLTTIKTTLEKMIDTIYPVGSVYLSMNTTNPSSLFGGTWTQIKDCFLLGCGDKYTSIGTYGGSEQHTHKYGAVVESYYSSGNLLGDGTTGLANYDSNGSYTITKHTYLDSTTHTLNGGVTTSESDKTVDRRLLQANTSYASNLPPYTTCYMWKRVA